jgi:cyclopropane fatty-acyl-phospholipid synthase-like methyltransferase
MEHKLVPQTSIYQSGEYLRKNPSWHAEDAGWKFSHVMQLMQRNGLEPKSVVEVGTGAGEVLRLLAEKFPDARLTGFDISPDAIRLASSRSTERLSFHHGNPFGRSGYDLAIALDVFEHVEDYLGFLREMTRLAPYQIYNIPLDLSVRYVAQKSLIMQGRAEVGHLHYFFKDTALASLEDTGHEVLDYVFHSPSLVRRDAKGAFRRWLFNRNPDLCVRLMGGFSMAVLCRSKPA